MTDTTTTPATGGHAPGGNTNCLAGLRCPRCGCEDRLYIHGTVRLVVTDGGADFADGSDMHWDGESLTVCPECDRDGPLADFRV